MTRKQLRRTEKQRRQRRALSPSKRKLAAAGGLTAGATLAMGGVAHADTFTVTNLNDTGSGSLRQAILDANLNGNGNTVDDIVFASGLTGTIHVQSTSNYGLYPESPMNIHGPGADKLTLDGGGDSYILAFINTDYNADPGQPVIISGMTLTNGNADGDFGISSGGAISAPNADLTISNAVITGNRGLNAAGGIFSGDGPRVTVIDSTISGNTADPGNNSYGGGIYAENDALIQGSTIVDNNARDGGGIYSTESSGNSLTIQRSTIARNHAVNDDGGGVWFCCGENGERLIVQSSTISGNSALTSGGGLNIYIGDPSYLRPEIDNTIVSGNTCVPCNIHPGSDDLYTGEPANVTFSLIQNPGPAGQITDTVPGSNIVGVDPQLGALASNGGPTQTMALAGSSPAVDKGSAFGFTTDQRGVLRPIDFPSIPNSAAAGADGSDIGAFELQPNNAIKLGKLKKNRRKGTAKQIVKVPLPAAGKLILFGKGLKKKSKKVAGKAKVKMKVVPKGRKKAKLLDNGKVKVKVKVRYKPTGNSTVTKKKRAKLIKRLRHG
jgi:hypothetical protein